MNDIDENIRETLSPEVAQLLAPYESDPSMFAMLFELFRGRNCWLNMLGFVFTLAGLAMAIVSAYQFFQTDDTRAMIAWAACFLWFVIWVAMLKMWFWLEMQKNSITREVKRLELQVAHLSRQLSTDN